jgi:predicted Zn finger-like uncharacterized protein
MPKTGTAPLFNCPNCEALYQVVEAEAGPETVHGDVPCRKCGGFLAGRKGEYVLKYFYLRGGARRPRNDLSLATTVHSVDNLVSVA